MWFPSQYGDYEVLNWYLSGGLRRLPQPANFHWQHGSIPRLPVADPDLIIGEGGWARFQKDELFFVARQDQAKALAGFGFNRVVAFGLPFAYALELCDQSQPRVAGSLLVLPADHHVHEDNESDANRDDSYIKSLFGVRHKFSKIAVSFHQEDLKRGRHDPWMSAGFEVIQGASQTDPSSLINLANLFMTTEYCSTNGFGSHIAYAAAGGCKISIWGPSSNHVGDNRYRPSFFQNRPDLARVLDENMNQLALDLASRGLYCDPVNAVEHREWGLAEIGYDNVLPPHQTLALLRETFLENPPGVVGRLKRLALSSFWPTKMVESLHAIVRKKQILRSYWANLHSAANLSIAEPPNHRLTDTFGNLIQLLIPGRKSRKLRFLDRSGAVIFRPWSPDAASLTKVFGNHEWTELEPLRALKIIDVGAGLGYFSAMFAMVFPKAAIDSVEPANECFAVLKQQARLMPQINPLNLAIGVRACTASLVGGGASKNSFKVVPAIVGNLETVHMVTLEDYLGHARFEGGIDILRLNVEGMEYEVLRASGETLASKVGALIVKFNYVEWKKAQILDIHNFLAGCGLVFFREIDEYQVFTSERVRANLTTL